MGIGGIGGVNGISGIGRMQDYSIQMPQPAKTVIVEETGAESHVASSEQINSGIPVRRRRKLWFRSRNPTHR